jgi:hypothetical protein
MHDFQIVIVSSGNPISATIRKFEKILNLTYIHTDVRGQINQKIIGLKEFSSDCEWIIFLDDDLLIPGDFAKKFKNATQKYSNYIGLGFNLNTQTKIGNSSTLSKLLARFFLLEGRSPGSILKSGHPVNYMSSKVPIETEWLSGASAWKFSHAIKYKSVFPKTKYAAYEDVIFSYEQSKIGKLLFDPTLLIRFQEAQPNDVASIDVFLSASYWRYYFVKNNSNFNKIAFFWSQIARSLYFLKESKGKYSCRVTKIYLTLSLNAIRGIDPVKLLNKYCGV